MERCGCDGDERGGATGAVTGALVADAEVGRDLCMRLWRLPGNRVLRLGWLRSLRCWGRRPGKLRRQPAYLRLSTPDGRDRGIEETRRRMAIESAAHDRPCVCRSTVRRN